MDVFSNDAMRLFRRRSDVTGDLCVMVRNLFCAEAERRRVRVAGLRLEARPVDGAAIEAGRRPRF